MGTRSEYMLRSLNMVRLHITLSLRAHQLQNLDDFQMALELS